MKKIIVSITVYQSLLLMMQGFIFDFKVKKGGAIVISFEKEEEFDAMREVVDEIEEAML